VTSDRIGLRDTDGLCAELEAVFDSEHLKQHLTDLVQTLVLPEIMRRTQGRLPRAVPNTPQFGADRMEMAGVTEYHSVVPIEALRFLQTGTP
jgi:hypothetical protein